MKTVVLEINNATKEVCERIFTQLQGEKDYINSNILLNYNEEENKITMMIGENQKDFIHISIN